jgi:two-component system, LuxR family, sensor kinase FixL
VKAILVASATLARIMHTFEPRRELTWLRAAGLSVVFLGIYILLDRVSYIHDLDHAQISAWAPNVAFLVAAAMYYGVRVAPLTILAPGLAECVVRSGQPFSAAVVGAMLCIGCIYTLAGILLRRWLRKNWHPTIGWFAALSIVIAVSALLDSMLYSAILIRSGQAAPGSYLTAVRTDWVEDVNGIIILVPLLLILYFGEPGKLREVRSRVGLLALQAAALVFVFLIAFPEAWGAPADDSNTAFYLLFLPIIWIALRWGAGVTAVALVCVQLGIVIFVAQQNTAESFLAIQVLMILLASTGLFMSISVSETARVSLLMRAKDVELSNLNARMAVSEMNSAIGHELNNPLAALVNYLRSASLIVESPGFDHGVLQRTLNKAQGEATRSINVVRKLREFFRSGVVRRERIDPKALAVDAAAAVQMRFRQANITAVVETSPDTPLIEADPLQLVMVLQNLLSNAYDAVNAAESGPRRVAVAVTHSGGEVMFSVTDTGSGIPDGLRDQLFRPVSSTKAVGMGLGLAICRSLVEANEGRISLLHSGAEGTSIAFWIPVAVVNADKVGR